MILLLLHDCLLWLHMGDHDWLLVLLGLLLGLCLPWPLLIGLPWASLITGSSSHIEIISTDRDHEGLKLGQNDVKSMLFLEISLSSSALQHEPHTNYLCEEP